MWAFLRNLAKQLRSISVKSCRGRCGALTAYNVAMIWWMILGQLSGIEDAKISFACCCYLLRTELHEILSFFLSAAWSCRTKPLVWASVIQGPIFEKILSVFAEALKMSKMWGHQQGLFLWRNMWHRQYHLSNHVWCFLCSFELIHLFCMWTQHSWDFGCWNNWNVMHVLPLPSCMAGSASRFLSPTLGSSRRRVHSWRALLLSWKMSCL